ncbi:MAG: hypothetical protein VX034_04235, partial [Planctomycetota bacterium]|nr:hypothetical protein [Planctomycetota bacterium]
FTRRQITARDLRYSGKAYAIRIRLAGIMKKAGIPPEVALWHLTNSSETKRQIVSRRRDHRMIHSFFTFLRLMVSTFRGTQAPQELAWGVTLGLAFGLIPNDSLLVAILGVVILATKTNLFVASVSVIVFSWFGFLGDELLHRLGARILTVPAWQEFFAWASNAPVVPWTRFNNTVAMGSIALSIALFYPTYHLSLAFFDNILPKIHCKLSKSRVYRFVTRTPIPSTSTGETT